VGVERRRCVVQARPEHHADRRPTGIERAEPSPNAMPLLLFPLLELRGRGAFATFGCERWFIRSELVKLERKVISHPQVEQLLTPPLTV
jgi:hypothetical protein